MKHTSKEGEKTANSLILMESTKPQVGAMEVKYRWNGKLPFVMISHFQMTFYMEVTLLGRTKDQTEISYLCKTGNQKLLINKQNSSKNPW